MVRMMHPRTAVTVLSPVFALAAASTAVAEPAKLFRDYLHDVPAPGEITQLALADFNDDGRDDLLIAHEREKGLSIFLAAEDGLFGEPTILLTDAVRHFTIADVNLDGRLDIILANDTAALVLRGEGDGSFAESGFAAYSFDQVGVADVNRDGRPDIVGHDGWRLKHAIGRGDGTFDEPVVHELPNDRIDQALFADFAGNGHIDAITWSIYNPEVLIAGGSEGGELTPLPNIASVEFLRDAAAADFNLDGRLDLAMCSLAVNPLVVVLGEGDGTFGPARRTTLPTRAADDLIVTDLNLDDVPDIIAVQQNAGVNVLHGAGDGSFTHHATIPVRAGFRGVSRGAGPTCDLGDINADGHLDFVIANHPSPHGYSATPGKHSVSVIFGAASGGFDTPRAVQTGGSPCSLRPADLNKDGRMDFALVNALDGAVSVFLAHEEPASYERSTVVLGEEHMSDLALGDLNGDGRLDAVTNAGLSEDEGWIKAVIVALGDDAGRLQPHAAFRPRDRAGSEELGAPGKITLFDVNDDGRLDILMSHGGGYLSWLQNDGDGDFALGDWFSVPHQAQFILIHDLDLDGVNDFIIPGSERITIMLRGEERRRSHRHTFETGSKLSRVVMADLNHDQAIDLIVSPRQSSKLTVFLGRGDGLFAPGELHPLKRLCGALAIGDLNNDGHPDIVSGSDAVDVLFGRGDGTFESPISSVVGGSMCAGLELIDFDNDGDLDIVKLDEAANVLQFIPNQLIAADGVDRRGEKD